MGKGGEKRRGRGGEVGEEEENKKRGDLPLAQ